MFHLFHFRSSFLVKAWEKQLSITLVFGPLPPTWETWRQVLAIVASWEWGWQMEDQPPSLFLSLYDSDVQKEQIDLFFQKIQKERPFILNCNYVLFIFTFSPVDILFVFSKSVAVGFTVGMAHGIPVPHLSIICSPCCPHCWLAPWSRVLMLIEWP